MVNISNICQKEIETLNNLINQTKQEIEIARTRAQSAEKMLEIIKKTASQEIKNAYLLGYKTAQTEIDDTSGGRKEENDKKLVLKTD